MRHTRLSLGSDSRAQSERNDCTVRAGAVVTGLSYDEVHAAMKARGRRKGRGLHRYKWEAALKDLGFVCTDITREFRGRTTRTLVRELRRRPSTDKYLVHVRHHVAGWNGVELVDHTKNRLTRIEYVLRVTPKAVVEVAPVVIKTEGTFKRTLVIKHSIFAHARNMNRVVQSVDVPRRMNRQKFIDEWCTKFADTFELQKMYYVELVGDAAVAERKRTGLRGKVYTIFGVES